MVKSTVVLCLALLCAGSAQGQSAPEGVMTIDELFQKLRDNSTGLKAQKSAVEAAQRGVEVAKSQRLPDVNANLAVSYNGDGFITDRNFGNYMRVDIPSFGNSFALQAQQAIYTGGAVSAGVSMAEIGAKKAEIGMEQNAQSLCFMALGQYLDLYKTDNQMRVYERNIQLTEDILNKVREKYEQGTVLKNDITRHELQLEQLRLAMQRLKDQRAIMNHQLCTTLGIDNSQLTIDNCELTIDRSARRDACQSKNYVIQPDTNIVNSFVSDPKSLGEWQQQASSSALDLQQRQLDIDMARQQMRLAKSELLPKVGITAAENFNGPITIEIPAINKNFNYWYVGVGVSYNLSSLYKKNKAVKKARVAEQQALENKTLMAEQVENRMQQAYTLYEQSFVDLRTQQKSVVLATQNYDLVNNRYQNQLALVTDMLDAENMKLQAELQEVNARINIIYSYYKLKFIANQL